MAPLLVLALLLNLQGCCLCSGVQRSSGDTNENGTALTQDQVISEASASPGPPTALNDRLATFPMTVDATDGEPTSTTSSPSPRSHASAGRGGGAQRAVRNRIGRTFAGARRAPSTHPVTTNGERLSPTASSAEGSGALANEKTERGVASADDPATAKKSVAESEGTPRPSADAAEPPVAGEAATERETRNDSIPTTTDNPARNESGDAVQETKSRSPCSTECEAPRRSHPVRHSSLLTKLVHRLSKPGAFEMGKSVFGDDAEMEPTLCPPGDIGLSCRQAEAMRGADECYGGNCEECRSCDEMAVTDWPHCCRDNFRCCSQLALACQQCDKPALQVFCTKHFKRCS